MTEKQCIEILRGIDPEMTISISTDPAIATAVEYRDSLLELLQEFNDGNHTCATRDLNAVFDVLETIEIPCTLDTETDIITTTECGITIEITQTYYETINVIITEPLTREYIEVAIKFAINDDGDDDYPLDYPDDYRNPINGYLNDW